MSASSFQLGQGWHSRGYLPHFDRPGLIQGITFRLADSVPLDLIRRWRLELQLLDRQSGAEAMIEGQEVELAGNRQELHRRIAQFEDSGAGECWLRQPDLAGMVADTLMFFDGERYEIKAFCVMPNHVHVMLCAFPEWALGQVIQSWKTWISRQANLRLNRTGQSFWAPDYYDRFIRDEIHYQKAVHYIHQNPVKAGLAGAAELWPWSSAHPDAFIKRSGPKRSADL